jgi:hypothetical protein
MGNPFDRRDKIVDVPHTFFEQIPDTLRPVTDEIDREFGFAVLRQQHHSRTGQAFADFDGGTQAIITVMWRHSNIDDDDIGTERQSHGEKFGRIPRLSDDIQPCTQKHPRHSFTEEYIVLADGNAHRGRCG